MLCKLHNMQERPYHDDSPASYLLRKVKHRIVGPDTRTTVKDHVGILGVVPSAQQS